ncbi:hypothetical protein [Frigoribacterium sp. SL97]|uniref:hypothetical protein n=1 Tax=Frigoribacterium sp. SL97 TaxID=2994664 RepID=UPI00226EF8DE|nr:hypothetical protein [Frigoribacterium sp. SL97]WAC50511.1 hypothetical protein OVA02_11575 [Frigoribacterium sp. SL97]
MTGPAPWAHLEARLTEVRRDQAALTSPTHDVADFDAVRAELADPASPECRDAFEAYNRAHRGLLGQK